MFNIQDKDTSKGHFYVSIIKSLLRLGAAVSLIMGNLIVAGALFFVAELLGILEEIV